jgi:hypothetical protein
MINLFLWLLFSRCVSLIMFFFQNTFILRTKKIIIIRCCILLYCCYLYNKNISLLINKNKIRTI